MLQGLIALVMDLLQALLQSSANNLYSRHNDIHLYKLYVGKKEKKTGQAAKSKQSTHSTMGTRLSSVV